MTEKLFDILTDDELHRLKQIGLTRNVQIKDLTMEECSELRRVFWPENFQQMKVIDVIKQFGNRRVL